MTKTHVIDPHSVKSTRSLDIKAAGTTQTVAFTLLSQQGGSNNDHHFM